MFSKIIYHRKQLRYYCDTIHQLRYLFDTINWCWLSWKPKSSCEIWALINELVTWTGDYPLCHPKIWRRSSYQTYFWNDAKHYQQFVDLVLNEMLDDIPNIPPYIIVEFHNCSTQYKSEAHLYSMEKIANKFNGTVVHLFGIPKRSKRKWIESVDWQALLLDKNYRWHPGDNFFAYSEDMVSFLRENVPD